MFQFSALWIYLAFYLFSYFILKILNDISADWTFSIWRIYGFWLRNVLVWLLFLFFFIYVYFIFLLFRFWSFCTDPFIYLYFMSPFPSLLFGWLFGWIDSLVSSISFDEFLFILYIYIILIVPFYFLNTLKKKKQLVLLFYYHNNFLYLSKDSTNIL